MKKLMQILMLSCKRAVDLIEKRSVFDISRKEKAQLRLHTSVCKACRNYNKQSYLIDKAVNKHLHSFPDSDPGKIQSKDLSERVISRLEEKYF